MQMDLLALTVSRQTLSYTNYVKIIDKYTVSVITYNDNYNTVIINERQVNF